MPIAFRYNLFHLKGYSLAELLLAVALLSLLLTLAVPGLRSVQLNRAMYAQINDLTHAVHLARHVALIRGTTIALCPSSDGQRCDYAAGWSRGWLLFTHSGSAARPQVRAANDVLLSHRSTIPVSISANRAAFFWRSYGRRSTNGTFMFCDPRARIPARRLVVSYTGKPRAERVPTGHDACAAT